MNPISPILLAFAVGVLSMYGAVRRARAATEARGAPMWDEVDRVVGAKKGED